MISLRIGSQHTARFQVRSGCLLYGAANGVKWGFGRNAETRAIYRFRVIGVVHGNHIWCSARRLAMIAYAVRERTLCGRPTESGTKTLVAALAGHSRIRPWRKRSHPGRAEVGSAGP